MFKSLQEKRARIEELEGWMRRLKSRPRETIEALGVLTDQVHEGEHTREHLAEVTMKLLEEL